MQIGTFGLLPRGCSFFFNDETRGIFSCWKWQLLQVHRRSLDLKDFVMSRLSYRIFPGKNGGKDVKKSTISSHIFCKSPICVERCWDSAFQILSSNLPLSFSQMERETSPNSPRLFWTRSLAVVKNLKLRWVFIREKKQLWFLNIVGKLIGLNNSSWVDWGTGSKCFVWGAR